MAAYASLVTGRSAGHIKYGAQTNNELTSKPDHSMGAGQLDVETKRVRAMFEAVFGCKCGEVSPDQIEGSDYLLLCCVIVDGPLKFLDFSAELVDLAGEIAVGRNSLGVFKVIGDPARNARLFDELMLFQPKPLVVLDVNRPGFPGGCFV